MKYIKSLRMFEIHYKDKYNDEYEKFRKEWSKYKNRHGYYVQFTNYKNDMLDKTSYASTDHTDPKGNYAYPLKYVLDYPMDIWYGANAKYLRVLKDKSKNILYLNDIKTKDKCISELTTIFHYSVSEFEQLFRRARKEHSHRLQGNTKWAKMLFQLVQVEYTDSDYRVRTSEEQRK
jgi:hypothetical protein